MYVKVKTNGNVHKYIYDVYASAYSIYVQVEQWRTNVGERKDHGIRLCISN